MQFPVSSLDKIDWNADEIGQIKNNVINILKTRAGEIPFMRDMGITDEYIDALPSEMKGHIVSDVIENLQMYEPRITVQSVSTDGYDLNGNIEIRVVVQI